VPASSAPVTTFMRVVVGARRICTSLRVVLRLTLLRLLVRWLLVSGIFTHGAPSTWWSIHRVMRRSAAIEATVHVRLLLLPQLMASIKSHLFVF